MKAKRRRLQSSKPRHTELHRYELLSINNEDPRKVGIKALTTDVHSEGQAAHVFKARYNECLPPRQQLESWAFVKMVIKDRGPVPKLTPEPTPPLSNSGDVANRSDKGQLTLPLRPAFAYH